MKRLDMLRERFVSSGQINLDDGTSKTNHFETLISRNSTC